MTRKHFKLLAAIIADIKNDDERSLMASKFGSVYASTNPLFNWDTWYKACCVPTMDIGTPMACR